MDPNHPSGDVDDDQPPSLAGYSESGSDSEGAESDGSRGSMPSLQTVSDTSDEEYHMAEDSERESHEAHELESEHQPRSIPPTVPNSDNEDPPPIPPPFRRPLFGEGDDEEEEDEDDYEDEDDDAAAARMLRSPVGTRLRDYLGGGATLADVLDLSEEYAVSILQFSAPSPTTFTTGLHPTIKSSTPDGEMLQRIIGALHEARFALGQVVLSSTQSEPQNDPVRADVIMSELEEVPEELVHRYEKLRSGHEEEFDGCAICRDDFFAEDEEFHKTQAILNGFKNLPFPFTYNADALILAFPCPGMHLFHRTCIAPWLARKTTCPSCRFDIDPDSLTLRADRQTRRVSPTKPWKPPAGKTFKEWLDEAERKQRGNGLPVDNPVDDSDLPELLPITTPPPDYDLERQHLDLSVLSGGSSDDDDYDGDWVDTDDDESAVDDDIPPPPLEPARQLGPSDTRFTSRPIAPVFIQAEDTRFTRDTDEHDSDRPFEWPGMLTFVARFEEGLAAVTGPAFGRGEEEREDGVD